MTEAINETGAFNSLRNIIIVNTADSMECRLTEIYRYFKLRLGAEVES